MLETMATFPNAAGLHARSAAMLVKTVAGFESKVILQLEGRQANARSLVELLRLGARQGHEVCIRVQGGDAAEALRTVRTMIENGFDEE
jgi:PTS hybrid protein